MHHRHGPAGIGKDYAREAAWRAPLDARCHRDEIKEGYVNTFGIRHDELPPDSNRVVTELFFSLVDQYLKGNISIVIEAAFQHHVWEPRMAKLLESASVWLVFKR